jgi:23S rRNA pseudouridine1911/1915/1917 synthase
MEKKQFIVSKEDHMERLDVFASTKSSLSRSQIQRLNRQGMLAVNSHTEKSSYRLKTGDIVELTIPDTPEISLEPEHIPIDVIYEDNYIIVVNKPAGMVVHPAPGHRNGTMINAILHRCKKLASLGSPLRPGIVHRLDKDTSGLIVVAKDDLSYLSLRQQFKSREVEKHYLALLYGNLTKTPGEINMSIGRAISDRKRMSVKTRRGREAITRYRIVKQLFSSSLAYITILTGRTHQIRVHFSASGHPVLGDRIYGKKTCIKKNKKIINFPRQMLHACKLRFRHPFTEKIVSFNAEIPDDMKKVIEELS